MPYQKTMALRKRRETVRETVRLYAVCKRLLRRGFPSRSVVRALSACGHDREHILRLCKEAYRELRRVK